MPRAEFSGRGSALVLACLFPQALVCRAQLLLHLVQKVSKEIPIVFVDTGYLFPATYSYALTLQEKLGFNAKVYSAKKSAAFQESEFGKLWEQGAEGMQKYNHLNKKEPMDRALKELEAKAWLAGLRQDQSSTREASLPGVAKEYFQDLSDCGLE